MILCTCLLLHFINSDTHFALVTKSLKLVATKATTIWTPTSHSELVGYWQLPYNLRLLLFNPMQRQQPKFTQPKVHTYPHCTPHLAYMTSIMIIFYLTPVAC